MSFSVPQECDTLKHSALRSKSIPSGDCSTLRIRQKVWNGRVQPFLKTENGARDIDLHPGVSAILKRLMGAHAFRRFRTTWLRKQHAPEDLIRFWLGHANKSVTDVYSKLKEDVAFRKKVAEQVGIGFGLPAEKPDVAPNCTQSELLSTSV